MKKLLITALIAFSIFGTGATSSSKNTKKDIVYIADKGTKFHTSGCRTLKKNKYEITRQEAIEQGYTACKVCKP